MADDGKIVRGKFSYTERQERMDLRERRVPCQIHGRWLQFSKDIKGMKPEDYLTVYVMTENDERTPRKLCELILRIRDLRAILDEIERQ